MSSLLSQVKTGKIEKPELLLIYGPDKVGKSSFAAQAPKPIFLGTEDGSANLDVARFPGIKSLDQVEQAIGELTHEKHEYQTLVVDSLDWLEPLVYAKVCREGIKDHIEDFGYGAGYKIALDEWRKIIQLLKDLQNSRQMNVILVGHSEIKTFTDPQEGAAYDRYQLKLYERAGALFREFVEVILFANFEVSTLKDKKSNGKTFAFGDGERKIFTERRPGFDAGNRFGLPFELELSWKSYVEAKSKQLGETPDQLRKSITGLLKNVKDKEIHAKATAAAEKAGNNVDLLRDIKRRLTALTAA
jgi:hypothetical protein